MEFTFGGEFVSQLVLMAKKDPKLARAMAAEVMTGMDLEALGVYLMRGDVAVGLLTARIMRDPATTLAELHALEQSASPSAKKPPRTKRAVKAPVRKKPAAPARTTRKRLTRDEAEQKKSAILTYLDKNPWSGRKQITAVAQVSTQAVYARLMSELKNAGVVVSRGQKAKTRYAVATAKKDKKGKGKGKKGKGKKGKGKKGKGTK